jgi:hypothetical protein
LVLCILEMVCLSIEGLRRISCRHPRLFAFTSRIFNLHVSVETHLGCLSGSTNTGHLGAKSQRKLLMILLLGRHFGMGDAFLSAAGPGSRKVGVFGGGKASFGSNDIDLFVFGLFGFGVEPVTLRLWVFGLTRLGVKRRETASVGCDFFLLEVNVFLSRERITLHLNNIFRTSHRRNDSYLRINYYYQ